MNRDLLYNGYAITMAEIPDEISLCFNIAGCPCHCPGCSEPWLAEWKGRVLKDDLQKIMNEQLYFTCVTFMGGDANHSKLAELADIVRKNGYKTAMYSGLDDYDEELAKHLDYYKVGHWDADAGPLNKETTNQHMYRIIDGKPEDITYMFWPK